MKTTGLWFRGKGESAYQCQYAAAWEQLSQKDFVGVVCGQVSSDRQDMMRFIIKTDDQGAVKYLILENVETISGRTINFDKLDPRIQNAASSSKQSLLDLHDEMEWDIGGGLVLQEAAIGQMSSRSLNTLVLGEDPDQLIEQVFCAANISLAIPEDPSQQPDTPSGCPSCHATTQLGAKFCPECGTKLQQNCGSCGAVVVSGAKFCSECGAKVEQKVGAGETVPVAIKKGSSPYLLTILVNDEGVSYEITLDGDQCSWEDNLRNELSLGAQYIILKMLDDIECEIGEWSSHQLEQFYSDRTKELAVLKSSKFISDGIEFNFRDERTQNDGANQTGSIDRDAVGIEHEVIEGDESVLIGFRLNISAVVIVKLSNPEVSPHDGFFYFTGLKTCSKMAPEIQCVSLGRQISNEDAIKVDAWEENLSFNFSQLDEGEWEVSVSGELILEPINQSLGKLSQDEASSWKLLEEDFDSGRMERFTLELRKDGDSPPEMIESLSFVTGMIESYGRVRYADEWVDVDDDCDADSEDEYEGDEETTHDDSATVNNVAPQDKDTTPSSSDQAGHVRWTCPLAQLCRAVKSEFIDSGLEASIFVQPQIPSKKLDNAMFVLDQYELEWKPTVRDVRLFIDDTVMGSGKDFFLMTDHVMFANQNSTFYAMKYDDIESIEYKVSMFVNGVFIINGFDFFIASQLKKPSVKRLVDLIADMWHGNYQEASDDDQHSSSDSEQNVFILELPVYNDVKEDAKTFARRASNACEQLRNSVEDNLGEESCVYLLAAKFYKDGMPIINLGRVQLLGQDVEDLILKKKVFDDEEIGLIFAIISGYDDPWSDEFLRISEDVGRIIAYGRHTSSDNISFQTYQDGEFDTGIVSNDDGESYYVDFTQESAFCAEDFDLTNYQQAE